MKTNTYYLSLGTNIEPRLEYLVRAKKMLSESGIVNLESRIYETEPLGATKQWFLNQVIEYITIFTPPELLEYCKIIEKKLGRESKETWSDRQIDLDIVLYNSEVIDTLDLHIPHLELANRKFVLIPLAEIAPLAIEPRSKKTIIQLLNECNDTLEVNVYAKH